MCHGTLLSVAYISGTIEPCTVEAVHTVLDDTTIVGVGGVMVIA